VEGALGRPALSTRASLTRGHPLVSLPVAARPEEPCTRKLAADGSSLGPQRSLLCSSSAVGCIFVTGGLLGGCTTYANSATDHS